MARLLLVETVVPGRFIGGNLFPFAHGLAALRGVPSRWLRFAVEPDVLRRHAAGLAPDDVEALRRALADATHVLWSRRPAEALVEALCREGLRMAAFRQARDGAARGPVELLDERGDDVEAWLGLPRCASGPLHAAVEEPRYDFEPGNDAGGRLAPVVTVLTGTDCTYQRDLAQTCFFSERPALEGVPQRSGCTFCGKWREEDGAGGVEAFELLRRQLVALARTHPRGERPALRVMGAAIRADPARAARLVRESGAPPLRLLLDYRADELARTAEKLREAAGTLQAAGHRLEVCLVGLESFSARQLDRYNKGYAPDRNLRAVRVLRELARDFAAFSFEGLSTITYDPWTTPGEVAWNLAVVRRMRLQRHVGKLFTSRLRLEPGLPLAAAARADGLLVERYEDPRLDTARANYYGEELPWRFADPRVEAVNRLTTRLEDDEAAADDLSRKVRAFVQAAGIDWLSAAERFAHAAMERAEPLDAQALLAVSDQPAPAEPRDEAYTPAEEGPGDWFGQPYPDALATGTKPVLRVEERAGDSERALAERVPGATVLRRETRGGGELFASTDPERAALALALTQKQTGGPLDEAAWVDTTTRLGVALGYPECCARSFALARRDPGGGDGWLAVRRRLETPGPVDPLFHPGPLCYVPCSLRCEATRALAERVRPHLGPKTRSLELRELPTLLFCEDEAYAYLELSGEPERRRDGTLRLRGRLAAGRLDDARLHALRRGDEISVEPGFVRVLAGGRELAAFPETFLWWHREVVHAEFWQEYLREIEFPVAEPPAGREPPPPPPPEIRGPAERPAEAGPPRPQPQPAVSSGESGGPPVRPAPAPPPPETPAARLARAFGEVLAWLARQPAAPLRGFQVRECVASAEGPGWGEVRVDLKRGAERLHLLVRPRGGYPSAFCETAHLAAVLRQDGPADTREKQAVAQLAVQALERAVFERTRR